ncbi:MAG: 50S ribosomal protein L23 [Candidatus Aenigmatarchaeota archaeon]
MDPWSIVYYPYMTEKSIKLVTNQNTICFITNIKANKKQIKWAVEKLFNVKVEKIRTLISRKGEKHAYIKLKPEFKASDIATKFGML